MGESHRSTPYLLLLVGVLLAVMIALYVQHNPFPEYYPVMVAYIVGVVMGAEIKK